MKTFKALTIMAFAAGSVMPATASAVQSGPDFCIGYAELVCGGEAASNYLGWGSFSACAAFIYQECSGAVAGEPDLSGNIPRPGGGAPRCFVSGRIDAGQISNPSVQCGR